MLARASHFRRHAGHVGNRLKVMCETGVTEDGGFLFCRHKSNCQSQSVIAITIQSQRNHRPTGDSICKLYCICRNMKLWIAFHVLTASSVMGFSPSTPRALSSTTVKTGTPLFYIDESKEESQMSGEVDLGMDLGRPRRYPLSSATRAARATSTTVAVDTHEQRWMESLAFSLGLNETMLEEVYKGWAGKHGKTITPFRFIQWKRNYLMQQVWNKTNGEAFDLNEHGDLTKQEFDDVQNFKSVGQAIVRPASPDVGSEGQLEVVETSDKPKAPRFRQVKTFSGDLRFIQVNQNERLVDADYEEAESDLSDHPSNTPDRDVLASQSPSWEQDKPKRARGAFSRTGLLRDQAPR